MRVMRWLPGWLNVLMVLLLAPIPAAAQADPPPAGSLRLHGMVEPVRSHPVVAPRLAGTPF